MKIERDIREKRIKTDKNDEKIAKMGFKHRKVFENEDASGALTSHSTTHTNSQA